ncbi:hypothetical protein OKW21_006305 [Catalinimonas alkaloidigena]|nr:hypothetical protein [Catalinimonas alkaloidigena]
MSEQENNIIGNTENSETTKSQASFQYTTYRGAHHGGYVSAGSGT